MGTMLYAKGVFINRCFDALNLTEPSRVAEVHHDYVRAGADVIETNTFGANRDQAARLRPGRSAPRHQPRGRATRQGSGRRAGRMWPARSDRSAYGLSRGGRPEGRGGGVISVSRLKRCSPAASICSSSRRFATSLSFAPPLPPFASVCDLPVVAQMTIEEDGNSLDGTPPRTVHARRSKPYADVVGVNCSIGPAPMLETIERMSTITQCPSLGTAQCGPSARHRGAQYLSVVAGIHRLLRAPVHEPRRPPGGWLLRHDARNTSGRSRWRLRAFAKVARPRRTPPRGRRAAGPGGSVADQSVPAVPRAERSQLARAFADGRFATIVELTPPKGFVSDDDDRAGAAAEGARCRCRSHSRRPARRPHERACRWRC